MNDLSFQKIAEQSGVDRSTVSRALNYCGGVDAETALTIRQLAKELRYKPSDKNEAPFCGIVLPEKPSYYWQTIYRNLCTALQNSNVSVRVARYPRITDVDVFLGAVDAMFDLSPRVLIVSALACPEIRERLQSMVVHTPIFLLSERIEGNNLFYFGSDARQDGIALAEAFRKEYPERRRMLVIDMAQNSVRTNAFLSADSSLHVVHRLELSDRHPSSAAILARQIASEVTEPFDCVYCGNGSIPIVCLALDKLKIDPNVICIGYENPPGNAKFFENGRIGLTLCQDIAAQSELCAKAVIELSERRCFPNQKYNYIDSKILSTPGRNCPKERTAHAD